MSPALPLDEPPTTSPPSALRTARRPRPPTRSGEQVRRAGAEAGGRARPARRPRARPRRRDLADLRREVSGCPFDRPRSVPRTRTSSAAPSPSIVSSIRSFRNCFTSNAKPAIGATAWARFPRDRLGVVHRFEPDEELATLRAEGVIPDSAARPMNCETDRTPGTARSAFAAAAPTRVVSSMPRPARRSCASQGSSRGIPAGTPSR
jgi:hypothetical protein